MSDTTGKNGLDSYGVWVKNSPQSIEGEGDSQEKTAVDDLDLPDFGDLDESLSNGENEDIFKDMDFTSTAEDLQDDSPLGEGDTTLSADELANIAVSDAPEEDSFNSEDTALNPDELANITMGQEMQTEDASAQSDFSEPAVSFEEDASDEETAALSNAFFSDDSEEDASSAFDVPDSNATEEISFDDGDIDLGDFMSDDFGGSSKEPAEIQDEQTLNIDVGFDDEAKDIAVEDTPENEAKMNPPAAKAQESAGEEMFSSFDAAVAEQGIPEPASGNAESSLDSSEDGEIDLSEFGFDDDDSNIGMTNGPEGSGPVKKVVVDYDMKVTVDGDSKTPPVLDVINGKITSEDINYDSEETSMEQSELSPEISERGKEILEQIMGELSSLKDEIKNIKNEFADLQARPTPPSDFVPQTEPQAAEASEDSGGFFGDDDGDDTIALSGSEMSNILNSAQMQEENAEDANGDFSASDATIQEPAFDEPQVGEASDSFDEGGQISLDEPSAQEPQIEENIEPEMEETAISEDDLDIQDPTLEGLAESSADETQIEETQTEIESETQIEESDLPGEISIPKNEDFNSEAIISQKASAEDSLTDANIDFLSKDPVMQEPLEAPVPVSDDGPDVTSIMQENISLQEETEAAIGIGDDIDAAFDEADAAESNIIDDSLAQKDSYENSISDIMQENISLQEETEAAIGIGDDIDAAFDEADAAENTIIDNSLAEKEASENASDETVAFGGEQAEDPLGEDALSDVQVEEQIEEPAVQENAVDESEIAAGEDFSEPEVSHSEDITVDSSVEETVVQAPLIEEPLTHDFDESQVEDAQASNSSNAIPKDLKNEIVSVLSYMDQLLENLPEEKITEFAKSEHFVTYKKLFDELGLS